MRMLCSVTVLPAFVLPAPPLLLSPATRWAKPPRCWRFRRAALAPPPPPPQYARRALTTQWPLLPTRCLPSGVVHFQLPEGSVLSPGQLIARLDLDDPAAVRRCAANSRRLFRGFDRRWHAE